MLMKRSREDADVEAQAMANCLMLLARVGQTSSSSSPLNDLCSFQCKTCNKKFPSFQALGGHRASHKRTKLLTPAAGEQQTLSNKSKMHRCSVCGVEFSTGQALGGHMRRHRAAMTNGSSEKSPVATTSLPVLKRTTSSKRVFGFELDLDLNLTPAEKDDLKLGSTTQATPVLCCFI